MNIDTESNSDEYDFHFSDMILSSSSEKEIREIQIKKLEDSIQGLTKSIQELRDFEESVHNLENTNNNIINVNVNQRDDHSDSSDSSDSSNNIGCWSGLINAISNFNISCGINSQCCGS